MNELRKTLRYLIDSNNGFLDSLFHKKVLTYKHVTDITTSLYNRNDKLLDFLLNRHDGDCNEVMKALVETGQLYVAKFISSAGSKFQTCIVPQVVCVPLSNSIACYPVICRFVSASR
jgi:hypothetical protein